MWKIVHLLQSSNVSFCVCEIKMNYLKSITHKLYHKFTVYVKVMVFDSALFSNKNSWYITRRGGDELREISKNYAKSRIKLSTTFGWFELQSHHPPSQAPSA